MLTDKLVIPVKLPARLVFPVAFKEPVTVVFPERLIPEALVIPVHDSDADESRPIEKSPWLTPVRFKIDFSGDMVTQPAGTDEANAYGASILMMPAPLSVPETLSVPATELLPVMVAPPLATVKPPVMLAPPVVAIRLAPLQAAVTVKPPVIFTPVEVT